MFLIIYFCIYLFIYTYVMFCPSYMRSERFNVLCFKTKILILSMAYVSLYCRFSLTKAITHVLHQRMLSCYESP